MCYKAGAKTVPVAARYCCYCCRSAPTATTALAATVVAVAIIDAVAVAVVVVSIFLLYACLCLPKFGDWQANLKVTLAQLRSCFVLAHLSPPALTVEASGQPQTHVKVIWDSAPGCNARGANAAEGPAIPLPMMSAAPRMSHDGDMPLDNAAAALSKAASKVGVQHAISWCITAGQSRPPQRMFTLSLSLALAPPFLPCCFAHPSTPFFTPTFVIPLRRPRLPSTVLLPCWS